MTPCHRMDPSLSSDLASVSWLWLLRFVRSVPPSVVGARAPSNERKAATAAAATHSVRQEAGEEGWVTGGKRTRWPALASDPGWPLGFPERRASLCKAAAALR